MSFGYTIWWVGLCHPDRHRQEIERLFREAHEAYLQGRWSESKKRIERILARDETDADALMQLGFALCANARAGAGSPCVPSVFRIKSGSEVAMGDSASARPARPGLRAARSPSATPNAGGFSPAIKLLGSDAQHRWRNARESMLLRWCCQRSLTSPVARNSADRWARMRTMEVGARNRAGGEWGLSSDRSRP